MNEYRVTITLAEYGADEEAAERTLDAFTEVVPQAGAVVAQHLADRTLSVTFSIAATDPWAASNLAKETFVDGITASELEPTEILDICVTAVEYEPEPHVHRGELVSA